MRTRKNYKGLLQIDSTQEVYQICEVQITQKEMILSVIVPTVLKLI
ncbi:MAG: hypothetical protein KJO16_00175 [Muriicola sp.]|nr:hypothetical protein [Muriicola sp.]MBT8282880.1 hypothetical protein [Muriicola sp.]NNK12053.1 hypothetical protein [Flavobacteriaceae bacterium]